MSRMAGMAIENYLGTGPNMSAVVQNDHMRTGKRNIASYENEALVGSTAISEAAQTAAADAIYEAKGDYMAAQQQASNMSQMGGMLGNAIGGLGGLFGGGGGGGGIGGGGFTGVNWASSAMRDTDFSGFNYGMPNKWF